MRVLFLIPIFMFFVRNSTQQNCNINGDTNGHFYSKITASNNEENNAHDEPTLGPEFFNCEVKYSCTHVVKFKDTNTYQLVHGEAELKNIKRPIIVWEKQVEKKPETIVIQRRVDASVSFERNWADYKYGFGCPSGNFWLGLEKLHCLAGPGKGAILNITLTYRYNPDKLFYAAYSLFEIGNEADGYRLNIGSYSGNAGEFLIFSHNGQKFSTYDRDNDQLSWGNTASIYKGGWWYKEGLSAILNNLYPDNSQSGSTYMRWLHPFKSDASIMKSEMKIQITEKSNNC